MQRGGFSQISRIPVFVCAPQIGPKDTPQALQKTKTAYVDAVQTLFRDPQVAITICDWDQRKRHFEALQRNMSVIDSNKDTELRYCLTAARDRLLDERLADCSRELR